MSVVQRSTLEGRLRVLHDGAPIKSPQLPTLPQPQPRFAPIPLVKLCYTLVHAAEAVGIRDLADGEYLPSDKSLEEGIERQLNYLLDEVGCTRPGFRLLEIGCGYGHLLRTGEAARRSGRRRQRFARASKILQRQRLASLLLHLP